MDFFKIMFYGGGGEGVSVAIFYDRKKQQGIFNFWGNEWIIFTYY